MPQFRDGLEEGSDYNGACPTPLFNKIAGHTRTYMIGDVQARAQHLANDNTADSHRANAHAATTEGDGGPIPDIAIPYMDRRTSELKLVCEGGRYAYNAAMHAASTQYMPNDNVSRRAAISLHMKHCYALLTMMEFVAEGIIRLAEPMLLFPSNLGANWPHRQALTMWWSEAVVIVRNVQFDTYPSVMGLRHLAVAVERKYPRYSGQPTEIDNALCRCVNLMIDIVYSLCEGGRDLARRISNDVTALQGGNSGRVQRAAIADFLPTMTRHHVRSDPSAHGTLVVNLLDQQAHPAIRNANAAPRHVQPGLEFVRDFVSLLRVHTVFTATRYDRDRPWVRDVADLVSRRPPIRLAPARQVAAQRSSLGSLSTSMFTSAPASVLPVASTGAACAGDGDVSTSMSGLSVATSTAGAMTSTPTPASAVPDPAVRRTIALETHEFRQWRDAPNSTNPARGSGSGTTATRRAR